MVITFTKQLYTLMKAGVPLLKAMQIIVAQLPAGKFRNTMELLVQDIIEGKSLSASLSNAPAYFSVFYINMIKAAEASGNLVAVLKELVEHFVQQKRITRQVQSAIMYPIFVFVIAAVILIVLVLFVMPVFMRIFTDLGGALPPATVFLMNLSQFSLRWGWAFASSFILLVILFIILNRSIPQVKLFSNRLKWRIPLFGSIIKTMEVGRVCKTAGTLLSSGVVLVKVIDILLETTPGVLLNSALFQIRQAIEQGRSLSQAMEETGVFPLTLVRMIQVGEESGRIAELLTDAASDSEEEVSYAISGLLSLLEPVLIVVMGAIVGFIVIALFFPIFTMSTLIK
jgi:type II secretory pathway component PulF